MAVTYRVNPLTAFMARRLIRVPYVAMVNLLCGHRLVPELLQERCTPELLAATVERLLRDPTSRALQRAGFGHIRTILRGPGADPASAAAAEIMDMMERPTAPSRSA